MIFHVLEKDHLDGLKYVQPLFERLKSVDGAVKEEFRKVGGDQTGLQRAYLSPLSERNTVMMEFAKSGTSEYRARYRAFLTLQDGGGSAAETVPVLALDFDVHSERDIGDDPDKAATRTVTVNLLGMGELDNSLLPSISGGPPPKH